MKKRRWGLAVLGLIAMIGLIFILTMRNSYLADIAELRRFHVSLTLDDAKKLQPNDGANAAALYEKANDFLKEASHDVKLRTLWDCQTKPIPNQAERTYFNALHPALALVEKASEMPRNVGVPGKEYLGTKELSPTFDNFYRFVSLVISESRIDAADGHYDKAFEDLNVINGMVRQASISPGSLPFLSSNGSYHSAFRQFGRMLNDCQKDRKALLAAQRWAGVSLPAPSIRNAFGADFYETLGYYQYGEQHVSEFMREANKNVISGVPVQYRNRLALIVAERQDVHTARLLMKGLPKDESDWKIMHDTIDRIDSMRKDPAKTFSPYSFSLYEDFAAESLIRVACQRVARQSAAILLYRLDHGGDLPASLPLGGDDAIDPFSKKELIYRKTLTGFEIFSLGPDLKENTAPHHQKGNLFDWDPGLEVTVRS